MADEDFRSRVERIFGSLAFSRSTSPTTTSTSSARQTQSGSVWSLSGAEVEKREWKREQLASYDREEMPCASSFDEVLRQQRLSSTDRKEGEEGGNEDFDVDDDDWSIRASMGLDRTLDDEDEEDEYDKVALGKEDGGKGLPCGVRIRDPRANHAAAKMRLKEDELEANKISPSGVIPSKSKEPTLHPEESSKSVPPKPILKRKESCSDSEARTSKRVRFDVVTEETSKKPEDNYSVSASLKSALPRGKSGAQVPDYLVNPSKYTCYSFDPSSELNEKSQTQEFTDIPKDSKGLETSESESFKKVSFVPQKKTEDVREDGSNCSETKPVETDG
ncbi:BnaC09g43760D [Brassica napus]|uniref:BnaC09g43760D protein n=1 Tax=Brassica napus TaxID=3708 RepID=A0A078F5R1_BRANA|nr:BnaC09g43760D [Brassica napus]